MDSFVSFSFWSRLSNRICRRDDAAVETDSFMEAAPPLLCVGASFNSASCRRRYCGLSVIWHEGQVYVEWLACELHEHVYTLQ